MKPDIRLINNNLSILKMKEIKYCKGDLKFVVSNFIKRRDKFLKLTKKYKTPMYVYDSDLHQASIDAFKNTFTKHIPDLEIYYSMKLNHHPFMIEKAINNGLGIEVASLRELKIARKFKSKKILYYAPGKTIEDIEFIIQNSNNILLNVDSFNELNKIGKFTNEQKRYISIGIRINLPIYGAWMKYGIELGDLKRFWNESSKYRYIKLEGIHFHTSRNKDSKIYVESIRQIASYLKTNFSKDNLNQIKYIDFGGGYDTFLKEGVYPWETNLGKLRVLIEQKPIKEIKFKNKYFLLKSYTLEEYAKDIGYAIKKYLRPLVTVKYFTEPGRILSNDGMHILVKIVDIKDKKRIVVDGGVNLVGWQRFEHEYFPVINLINPSFLERECVIYGNLCTTWDLWGYYLYAKRIIEGDILIIPYQGALTYALAQNFINPIANVYKI